MKSLPERPSLDSLRKQAKKLARDLAAGDPAAIARVHAHLPRVRPPLTQRNAQLVVAREYGYAGWQDLTAEVHKRLGDGLDAAAAQASRAIHNKDVERLKHLLAERPALLSWQGDDEHNGLLGFATGAYGDAFGEERERWFTRAASAEVLIDAGAVVTSAVVDGLVTSRAVGLLNLFHRKGLLPRTLRFFAALGDLGAVRAALEKNADLASINDAFFTACGFHHEAVASALLERSIALDPSLGERIDANIDGGRTAFVRDFIELPVEREHINANGLWTTFVRGRVSRARNEGDLGAFVGLLKRERWLLGDAEVGFQKRLIEGAAVQGREDFIVALLEERPALLRVQPPPPSQAIEHAITYGHTELIPLLTQIWPLPDDLPHAAGTGNLARVRQWFDASGAPALGEVEDQFPHNGVHIEANDPWTATPVQKVLDTALAWSVINHHFDVADFLLAHGADINTRWNSHEPASILHTLVFEDDYEAMQFLIDRGIDMTIKDYRWDSDARGWARYGKSDEKMAQWLEEAERRRIL
jgi:ankyrin repeat protein